MAFRADEAAQDGHERARRYLAANELDAKERSRAIETLEELISDHGPVIQAYPTWHPLVPQLSARRSERRPNDRCGYRGLDHTICFVNGFVSCPYGDGDEIIDSVQKINHDCAYIEARKLDVTFYNKGTTSILVTCYWREEIIDHMIPKRLAVPLMIREEMRMWQHAEVGERWESKRPDLLGEPHGSRSSLFVTQETALSMKRAYMAMVESGMFGPLHLD